ncbi:hypothetical protein HK103_000684 [Boothiomyces macroporosus]|uniref:BHLH domain-containing protein n=1 Tax=Boothiomyces macroporosus TaxID=261099 RepID=A0AAD5UC80_9FUNG|nr:hypothetical protein HK103_000684 [Boothiomyces macroporosus]
MTTPKLKPNGSKVVSGKVKPASSKCKETNFKITCSDKSEKLFNGKPSAHSIVEKGRRDRIGNCISRLKALVPACASATNNTQLETLEKTIDYIEFLHLQYEIPVGLTSAFGSFKASPTENSMAVSPVAQVKSTERNEIDSVCVNETICKEQTDSIQYPISPVSDFYPHEYEPLAPVSDSQSQGDEYMNPISIHNLIC